MLKAVATALKIPLPQGVVKAGGDFASGSTLNVDKAAPAGFKVMRLTTEAHIDTLQKASSTSHALNVIAWCFGCLMASLRPELQC